MGSDYRLEQINSTLSSIVALLLIILLASMRGCHHVGRIADAIEQQEVKRGK